MSAVAATGLLFSMLAMGLVIFVAMLYIFAQLTGWRRLAKRYAHHGGAGAVPYRVECVVLGELGANSPPLLIGVTGEGLTLRPIRPFRPAFASLLIPWCDVVAAERKRYLLFEVLVLHISGASALVGFTPSAALEAIEARLPIPIRPPA
ncbi:MAG: hypothetical protein ACLPSH_11895 [Vulcanimicrobiaceae bacterium]